MECPFFDVDKRRCFLQLGCEGIREIILELGGNMQFAQYYSSFIWRFSMANRILDYAHDPAGGFSHILIKKVAQLLTVFLPLFVPDIFRLSHKLKEIESYVCKMEISTTLTDPMEYFQKVGEAYATAFRYAAVGARCDRNIREKVAVLGSNIGILIALRDAVQDLRQDRINRSFNPFTKWKKAAILNYYKIHATALISEITRLIQDKSSNSILAISSASKSVIRSSLLGYASIAVVPYSSCKTVHKASILQPNLCSLLIDQYSPAIWIIPIALLLIIGICICSIKERNCCCCNSSDCSGCGCTGSECSGCNCSNCDCSGCDCSGCDCSGCDCGGC